MARVLTHRELAIRVVPHIYDKSKLIVLNPSSTERSNVASSSSLQFDAAGWAFIKDENGTVTVLKNLLPSPVCVTPNGAKYIGYATGSKFITNLIEFKFVEWHPMELENSPDTLTVHVKLVPMAARQEGGEDKPEDNNGPEREYQPPDIEDPWDMSGVIQRLALSEAPGTTRPGEDAGRVEPRVDDPALPTPSGGATNPKKPNGLGQWMLQRCVAKLFACGLSEVEKLDDPDGAGRLIILVCRVDILQQLPQKCMFPDDVESWIIKLATDAQMLRLIASIKLNRRTLNWSVDVGCFQLVHFSQASTQIDAVKHRRSGKIVQLPEPFACEEQNVGQWMWISENQDETKSLLHVGRKGNLLQLKCLFEQEVEAFGLLDPVLLGLAPMVPVASSSGAAPSAVGSATINNNDI